MKKILLALPFVFAMQQALAINDQDEENYKTNYITQLKPLVVQKLSADRPEMTARAVDAEASAYVTKMAGCQLQGLSQFPETYREKAIKPVAQGADIAQTTHDLNTEMLKDIESGKLSKEQATIMVQNAQETVQICLNS
ncbi:hypothetical protein [Methylophaga nitratireducenticrescens]|uniref:Uncharacterized protein n=1 Tax=Methylophaga nitratireducenticrescens TaxID=754476 RepID=I1XGX0_METNJ|nr:hypothetical protein [Methylophaga nitratireducenticrescens]AFI83639.1 hypothetical protein Q7A_794 [Methylophaga nitratireducenticrescens]AUZ83739.1 hypothetical protein CDW43_03760 [Methylophaga nitratireducenticrescens]